MCGGSGTNRISDHSIYQSDGLCYDFCKQSFALAIVQDDSCWCSNYVPNKAIQVSTSQCSKSCPGFPDDVCGGDGLFGYMLLEKQPSGTVGTGTPTPSTSQSSSVCIPSALFYPPRESVFPCFLCDNRALDVCFRG